MKHSEKGQTMVEALVLSTAFIGIVSMILSCLYIAWLYTCLNFISHEYLVCQSFSNIAQCEQTFSQQLKKISIFGSIGRPHIRKSSKRISLQMQIRWNFLMLRIVDLEFKDQIHLPLKP